jgi:putative ABC transport system substrate-binding protein
MKSAAGIRRKLVIALGAITFCAPVACVAQKIATRPRIGFLSSELRSDPNQAKRLEALTSALRSLGYIEGENIVIEQQWADGHYERLPNLAADLVASKVNVIVTSGTKATVAASKSTNAIPIVMGSTGDPIALGLTSNLSRPSGNVTGRTNMTPELGTKLLGLLKEIAPGIARVAYLVNPVDPSTSISALQASVKSLGVTLLQFEADTPNRIDPAMAEMVKTRCDAVAVQADTLFEANVQTIARLAQKHRLPSAAAFNDFAEAGGLIAYAPDRVEGYRRAAVFVDKILKGARPSELAIERPTRFELVLNVSTARSLGLAIPQSLLLRADRTID